MRFAALDTAITNTSPDAANSTSRIVRAPDVIWSLRRVALICDSACLE
jgi:hypothetical protein